MATVLRTERSPPSSKLPEMENGAQLPIRFFCAEVLFSLINPVRTRTDCLCNVPRSLPTPVSLKRRRR